MHFTFNGFPLRLILWATFFTVFLDSSRADSSEEDYAFEASPEFTLEDEEPTTVTPATTKIPERSWTQAPPQPLSPTTTAATTTTTERIPLPFENQTNEVIQQNHDSISVLQRNLATYDIQLNLNALNTLLPKLKELRQSMSNLLSSSPPNLLSFENQSSALNEKMTELEVQIQKNRVLLEHYEDVEKRTQEQLRSVYAHLGATYLSQVNILTDEGPDTARSRTEREIFHFINGALVIYYDTSNLTQGLKYFLQNLQTPENRLFAYNYTLHSLRSMERKVKKTSLLVQIAKNVFKFPELSQLKPLLPPTVQKIFTDEPKIMKMRDGDVGIGMGIDGSIEVKPVEEAPSHGWNFYAFENSEFFAIIQSSLKRALGDAPTGSGLSRNGNYGKLVAMNYTSEESIKSSRFYQWRILAFYSGTSDSYYIKFINAATGLALGGDSIARRVTMKPPTDSAYQDWELQ